MSEISRELRDQQIKDAGKVFEKLFPDAPHLTDEDKKRITEEQVAKLEAGLKR